jgi:hypothetical protein
MEQLRSAVSGCPSGSKLLAALGAASPDLPRLVLAVIREATRDQGKAPPAAVSAPRACADLAEVQGVSVGRAELQGALATVPQLPFVSPR